MDRTFWKGTQFIACLRYADNIGIAHRYRRSKNNIHQTASYNIYGKNIGGNIKRKLIKMNNRLWESGLQQDQHEIRSTYETPYFELASPSARLCLYTTDVQHEVGGEQVEPFGLEYILFALYIFCGGFVVSFIFSSIQSNSARARRKRTI